MSPAESWTGWTTRIAADLNALDEGDWLTFVVRASAPSPSPYAAAPAPRRWRRRGDRTIAPTRVPDVLMQARVIEGVLALECISDTEFEGLSDLTREDESALTALGWVRDGGGSELSRVFGGLTGGAGRGPGSGREAAELLRSSLGDVLGARTPDDVDLRHGSHR
ncbi:MAG: hypothetical protein ABI336_01625 [Humibacillus sp.]